MKTISVMIPCYNEEDNARPIYETVKSIFINELPEYDYEILFIDNKSRDNTRLILREICAEDKKVKAIFWAVQQPVLRCLPDERRLYNSFGSRFPGSSGTNP